MTPPMNTDDLPITITLTNRQMSIVFTQLQLGPYGVVADIVPTFLAQFSEQLEAYRRSISEQAAAEHTSQRQALPKRSGGAKDCWERWATQPLSAAA